MRPSQLALLAALALGSWIASEGTLGRPIHPRYVEMVEAARTARRGSAFVLRAKERLSLVAPQGADPNRTGLIGPEWSGLVTTRGHLPAKRTTTNPDFAGAVTRVLASLNLARGDRVVVVMSGSFPGANIATLAAVQALDLKAVPVASVSASMWGASDPEFNWLAMHAMLRQAGVLKGDAGVAVIGGDMAIGRDLAPDIRASIRTDAVANGVTILEDSSFDVLIERIDTLLRTEGGELPRALVNVGGSMIGLGTCTEAHRYSPGLHLRPLECRSGTAGLMARYSQRGIPVLHLLNMRRIAIEFGLPYDPIPLPRIGENRRVYGTK